MYEIWNCDFPSIQFERVIKAFSTPLFDDHLVSRPKSRVKVILTLYVAFLAHTNKYLSLSLILSLKWRAPLFPFLFPFWLSPAPSISNRNSRNYVILQTSRERYVLWLPWILKSSMYLTIDFSTFFIYRMLWNSFPKDTSVVWKNLTRCSNTVSFKWRSTMQDASFSMTR